MTAVNFRAIYIPDKQKFQVEASDPDGRHVEMMSEARFKQFIDHLDTEIDVGGTVVKFDGGAPNASREAKDYFRKVYRSFQEAKQRGQA
jgi:hypothetical protein